MGKGIPPVTIYLTCYAKRDVSLPPTQTPLIAIVVASYLNSNRSGIPVSRSWHEGFSLECSPDGRDDRLPILPHC